MFKLSNIEEYFQKPLKTVLRDNQRQIKLLGYITVFIIYLLTHLINLVEYPAFSGDEMFYVLKAVIWQKTGTPSMPKWDGHYEPEFTNPSTLAGIYIILSSIFDLSPLLVRSLILIVGLLNLLMVFLVGREMGESDHPWQGYLIGIIGGLVLALDPQLVFYSRTGYLDNPMNLFLTISLFFYLRYLKTNDQNYAWLAGLAGGVALWFKLSAVYFLIGLGLFSLITRKIDAALRVQVMMTFFLGLYVLWGLSIDPIAFAKDNYLHISGEYKGHSPTFWGQLVFGYRFGYLGNIFDCIDRIIIGNFDPIRILILFSLLIPVFYLTEHKNFFYKSSFLVLCFIFGATILFYLTKVLDHYITGFASFYAILFASSLFFAFKVVKFLQDKLLEFIKPSPNYYEIIKRGFQLVVLAVFLLGIVAKFQYHPLVFPPENQDTLKVIAYVEQEIPSGETIVAPSEIGPWLNASGYSVYTIGYINASPPDSVVREYIQKNSPSYVILPNKYLYIVEGLNYSILYSSTEYTLYELMTRFKIPL